MCKPNRNSLLAYKNHDSLYGFESQWLIIDLILHKSIEKIIVTGKTETIKAKIITNNFSFFIKLLYQKLYLFTNKAYIENNERKN